MAVVTASCGPVNQTASGSAVSSHNPSSAGTATVSPTPTPVSGPLAACLSVPTSSPSASDSIIAVQVGEVAPFTAELVDLQGDVLNHISATFPGEPDPNNLPVTLGVGPAGVYLYYPGTGEIARLGISGPPQQVGQTQPNVADDLAGFAESPNGQCWIFSIVTWDGSNVMATSQLFIGGIRSAPLLVATLTRNNSVNNT